MQPAPVSPPPAPAPPAGDPLTQPLIDFLPSSVLPAAPSAPTPAPLPAQPAGDPTWPCTTCGAPNALSADHCATCGGAFLATVAAQSRSALVLPIVGDLTRMSRAQRVLGALTVVVVLVLFVAMVTLLLAKRPPDQGTTVNNPTVEPSTAVVQPTPTLAPTATPTPTATSTP